MGAFLSRIWKTVVSMLWSEWKDTDIISVEDVLLKLQRSRSFSWSIYRKEDAIRHVGFVIFFDEEPFCTVDFNVEEPDPSCLFGCPSLVVIETVPLDFENCVDYLTDAIQYLDFRNKHLKRSVAAEVIRKLVTPNKEYYSLLFNNCRDNTEDVVNLVCDSGQCNNANLEDAKEMLLTTRCEDILSVAVLFLIISQLTSALEIILPQALSTA